MLFKNNPTKEKIIYTLAKNWPLSITEMREQSKFPASYQYTRQCLSELMASGIVLKKGFKYELSAGWLKEISTFSRETLENYKFGMRNNLFTEKSTQITVNSLYEMGHFMLEALESRFLEKKDSKGFFCLLNHLWIPFLDREKQQRILHLEEPISVVHAKNYFLDKVLYRLCYKKNCLVKFVPKENDADILVYHHCVFQIYIPEELRQLMDKLYSQKQNPFKWITDLLVMTYHKFPIHIIITRNKALAEQYQKRISSWPTP